MSDEGQSTPGRRPSGPGSSSAVQAKPDLYRLIADSSMDWQYLEDPEGRLLWVSPACERLTGHAAGEFLRDPGLMEAVVDPRDREHFLAHRAECRKSDEEEDTAFRIRRADGTVLWIGHRCRPVSFPGWETPGRRCANRDITARKTAEAALLRLNRTLRALSDSNQALVRASEEKALLDETCRIIVETCGHAMVWIGYAEEDARRSVRPVSHYGFEDGYLETLSLTWADTERGRGPTGTAIRTGKPAGCRNMRTDPDFSPWREEALKRGFASSIVLPLFLDGRTLGAITIYSGEPEAFPEDEVRLLSELAGDLSYGIETIRQRAAHAKAEEALRASEERYRTLFESMSEGVALCEMVFEGARPVDFVYLEVNPAFERLTGLREVVGKKVTDVIPGIRQTNPELFGIYGRVASTGAPDRFETFLPALETWFDVSVYSPATGRFVAVFDNITERKGAEETLEAARTAALSEKGRLEAVMEALPVGIVILDEKGGVLRTNDALEKVWGGTPPPTASVDDNAAFKAWWTDSGLPVQPGEWASAIALREAKPVIGQSLQIERFDRRRAFVLNSASPILDPGGRVTGCAVAIVDITESREGEAHRRLLETALRAAANAIVITGPDGTIEWVNPAFVRRTGYSADEAVGKSPRILKSGRHGPAFYKGIWETIVAGGVWQGEIVNRRKDGSLYNEEMTITPVTDAGGAIRHFVAVKQEITERKRAEAAVRESEERLRLAQQIARVGTFDWDLRTGRIRWGEELEGMHGLPAGRFPGTLEAWEQMIHRLDRQKAVRAIGDAAERGERLESEWRVVWPNGTVRWLAGRASILKDASGLPRRMVGAQIDITERKQAEERLRELNETLEERVTQRTAEVERTALQLRALAGELTQAELRERRRLAGVLHDHLQQVLAAAKLNLDALFARSKDEGSREGMARIGELIEESIAECRSLTLGLSPPVLQEAGLEGAVGWLARRAQEQHGLSVSVTVGAGWIEPGDPDVSVFLFEAVRELLFNVVKHSGVQEAEVALSREDGQVEVRVVDRGRGLDREALRDRRGDAVGFGLFSIQQRLQLIGGSMDVEGAPGLGTCVVLRAPAGSAPRSAAPAAGGPAVGAGATGAGPVPEAGARIRVVIADDHRILRQGLIALLRGDADIEVVGEAADGAEAVDMARSLRPDVVVMDVSMPKLNGIEATRLIAAELPGIKVVGLSMHEDEEIAASMREAGALEFVTKGGRSDALITAIHAAHRHGADGLQDG